MKKFLFRSRQGSLADSMRTLKVFDSKGDMEKYAEALADKLYGNIGLVKFKLKIKPYSKDPDLRVGWDFTDQVIITGCKWSGVKPFDETPIGFCTIKEL